MRDDCICALFRKGRGRHNERRVCGLTLRYAKYQRLIVGKPTRMRRENWRFWRAVGLRCRVNQGTLGTRDEIELPATVTPCLRHLVVAVD
jgi:hypothetical protein